MYERMWEQAVTSERAVVPLLDSAKRFTREFV